MYEKYVKRLIDFVLSAIGIIVLSWLYLILAIAILVDDPSPILFKQKRVGKGKTYFSLYNVFDTVREDRDCNKVTKNAA